jgi:hypothetical protein
MGGLTTKTRKARRGHEEFASQAEEILRQGAKEERKEEKRRKWNKERGTDGTLIEANLH